MLRNIGGAKYIVCPTNLTVGRATARLAHYVPAPMYWWSFGTKSLSLMVSKIFCPKPHVFIDIMLNCHCTCAISRDMYPLCKN